MDEVNLTQQYYIAAKSSPHDDRTRVLKFGQIFAVFDGLGDIQTRGMGEQGIFFQGTRHLSEQNVYLWNSRPLLLSSTIETSNVLFSADLANLDVSRGGQVVIPRGTLHLLRSKFLWQDACYEEFRFDNYGPTDLLVPFRMTVDADFADIFEVRGTMRAARGERLEGQAEGDSIVLTYCGLDRVLRRTRVTSDSRPQQVSASAMSFEVALRPQGTACIRFLVSCDAQAARPQLGYTRALALAAQELKTATESAPEISCSNSRFNDWVKRSVADIHMMTVGNPEVDYPYAGIPWFSTVFGRDGIIAALQTLWIYPAIARGVLDFLASTQSQSSDPDVEAQPGKILHEMRRGEMAALKEVPFGRYYGTVDATPLFVMLAGAYYERTGDRAFLARLWPNLELALAWIDDYGDLDGDGFVEYARQGSQGLVQQGWKDSNDSVFHEDGTLAEAPIALCEVQGYVYAGKLAAARVAEMLGKGERSRQLQAQAEELRARFDAAFWCPELSLYALALDGQKKPCRVRTSNAGHCLFSGIAMPDKAALAARSLLDPDFFTGWGVRTVARGEARYNPLSYHNGSVWPHDNSLVAAGLSRYGFKQLAGRILLGMLDASSAVELHRLPELFCGLDRRLGEGPTLYPVACSPQAWASGAVFLLLSSSLGISIDEKAQTIHFDYPCLPEGLPQLWIKNLRVGEGSVDLLLEREQDTVAVQVLRKSGDLKILVNL